jgi:ABC-type multidrug transport system permease subunit
MSTITASTTAPTASSTGAGPATSRVSGSAALGVLARRRFALSVRTPRELLVPLLAPVMFAIVIAPALDSIGPTVPGVDYMSFTAVGIAGLLIPLNSMFAGIGAVVDREGGARRDLLAAPVSRPLLVLANLAVALCTTALQVAVLIGASVLRGAELDVSATGLAWFIGAAGALAVAMYGVAETIANKVASVEDFTAAVPGIAIVPFFFAGSLFPISALPAALTALAKVVPLTHALALMRYGLLGGNSSGLHDIWGMSNATAMAALSIAVVAAFAAVMTFVAMRVFRRAAVQ